jgi:hypothetical protein
MNDRYNEVCSRLTELVRPGFGGYANPGLVSEVRRLAEEAMRIADDTYITEKARSLISWTEIACSPRRHTRWGLERVEQFAFQDAYRLSGGPVSRL